MIPRNLNLCRLGSPTCQWGPAELPGATGPWLRLDPPLSPDRARAGPLWAASEARRLLAREPGPCPPVCGAGRPGAPAPAGGRSGGLAQAAPAASPARHGHPSRLRRPVAATATQRASSRHRRPAMRRRPPAAPGSWPRRRDSDSRQGPCIRSQAAALELELACLPGFPTSSKWSESWPRSGSIDKISNSLFTSFTLPSTYLIILSLDSFSFTL
jgi:hypothetical protein